MRKHGAVIVAQHYEIGERLGTGGEAHVFRARHRPTGTEVALRLTPPNVAGEMRSMRQPPEQFPGWVRLLDHGIDPAHGVYSVFELLRGETLGAMLARGVLPAQEWHRFVRESLDAVDALHRAGWVHGDLNADNFLLHEGSTWKLLDLPFHDTTPAEMRSPLFGSIYTMAPEQFAARAPDVRSDLYALGCLYYAAAAGAFPHAGGTEADIAIGRLRFPPEPLEARSAALTSNEAGWVMRLLAIDPVERPADVGTARQLLMQTSGPGPLPRPAGSA